MGRRFAHNLTAVAAALGAMVAALAAATGGDWPAKPVRVIVAYSAGGANDLLGRVFAERLGDALGQQFFVENRTGGGGLIGTAAVARAEPDGYTLIVSGMPSHVLAPAMNRNAGFDPVRDFTHIAYLGGPPNVFAVHNSSPVKTFKELLALMRAQKEGMEYVSPSIGSVGNMVAEYVAAREHVRLTHVVYRGGGAAILDLVAGHVKLGSMTLSTMREHIRAGTLRPLAISSAQRVPELPDVPTLVELGYPQLVVRTWYGLSGPAGLSPQIVDEINTVVNKSMQLPKVQEQLAGEAIETKAMTPAEFTRFLQDEVNKWVAAIDQMNIGAK
jgi:tripartite-type tricarboxylate transporter receptor subunit TctC